MASGADEIKTQLRQSIAQTIAQELEAQKALQAQQQKSDLLKTGAEAVGRAALTGIPGANTALDAAKFVASDPQRALELAPAAGGVAGSFLGLPGAMAGGAMGKGIEVGGKAVMNAMGQPTRPADSSVGIPFTDIGFTIPSPDNKYLKPITQVATEGLLPAAFHGLAKGTIKAAGATGKGGAKLVSGMADEAIDKGFAEPKLTVPNSIEAPKIIEVATDVQEQAIRKLNKVEALYKKHFENNPSPKDASQILEFIDKKAIPSITNEGEGGNAALKAAKEIRNRLADKMRVNGPSSILPAKPKQVNMEELHQLRKMADNQIDFNKQFGSQAGNDALLAIRTKIKELMHESKSMKKLDADYADEVGHLENLKRMAGTTTAAAAGKEIGGASASKFEGLLSNFFDKKSVDIHNLKKAIGNLPDGKKLLKDMEDIAVNEQFSGKSPVPFSFGKGAVIRAATAGPKAIGSGIRAGKAASEAVKKGKVAGSSSLFRSQNEK